MTAPAIYIEYKKLSPLNLVTGHGFSVVQNTLPPVIYKFVCNNKKNECGISNVMKLFKNSVWCVIHRLKENTTHDSSKNQSTGIINVHFIPNLKIEKNKEVLFFLIFS